MKKPFVIAAMFMAGVLATGQIDAAEPAAWRISHEIEGFSRQALPLCLVKARRGPAKWAVSSPEEAGPDCAELLMFERDTHTVYMAFPDVLALAEYQCSAKLSIPGRHPCFSPFFPPQPGRPEHRRLDRELLRQVLDESGAFKQVELQLAREREQRRAECVRQLDQAASVQAVDQLLSACAGAPESEAFARAAADKRARLDAQARSLALQEYRQAFEALARSSGLEAAEAFIARYSRDDPDRLVPRAQALLDERVKQLQAQAREQARRDYLEAFASLSADSPSALLEAFIVRYSVQGDPDKLVPRVRAMLEGRLRRLQAQAADRERRQRLEALETTIAQCKRVIAEAQAVKRREQKIAADSGYVQPHVLRAAAANEVDCNQIIDESYERYRQLGGGRSRAEIQ